MKNFLSAVIENLQPLPHRLLFSSFIAGYVLAIIIYQFFSTQVHQFLDIIFQGL